MAENGVTWAEINDRLAELDGKCRHPGRWEGSWEYERGHLYRCVKCRHTVTEDDVRSGDLPTVGSGTHAYTLEQILGLAKRLGLTVMITSDVEDVHEGYRALMFSDAADMAVALHTDPDPRIALGTAIIRAMEGE